MKLYNKYTAIVVIAFIIIGCFISCDTKINEATTTTYTYVDDTTVYTDDDNIRDSISDDIPSLDFGGIDFKIFCREDKKYEVCVDGEAGEIVNDTTYNRNRNIEERFNIRIVPVTCPGDWDNNAVFKNTLSSSILTGSGDFDLMCGYSAYIVSLVTDNLFINLNTTKYLNLEKPWWMQQINDEMNINGKMYLATGDISLTLWDAIYVYLFNKTMAKDYEAGDIYQLVRDGKWTLEALQNIVKDVSRDMDGNDKLDENDLYGFATLIGNFTDNYMIAFDQPVTTFDDNGIPYLTENNERMVEIISKLRNLLYNTDGVISKVEADASLRHPYENMFFENRVMFIPQRLGEIEKMRSMDTDFGIIPYPMYNENQSGYFTSSHNSFSMFGIPIDAKDSDMSAAILEALCAESYKTVVPAFYETALKSKYARDDESSEMLDIIRSGMASNFGFLHMVPLSGSVGHGPGLHLRATLPENAPEYLTYYEKNEKIYKKELEKIIEKYLSLD